LMALTLLAQKTTTVITGGTIHVGNGELIEKWGCGVEQWKN
jgi:hypothetical protein